MGSSWQVLQENVADSLGRAVDWTGRQSDVSVAKMLRLFFYDPVHHPVDGQVA